jgi:sec-independent protein translocase protein TatA
MDLFSGPHIILIALLMLLMFGGKKIPELMRGLGKGIREFNDAKDNVKREIGDHINEPPVVNEPPVITKTTDNKYIDANASKTNQTSSNGSAE